MRIQSSKRRVMENESRYSVQVGIFRTLKAAEEMKKRVEAVGYPVSVEPLGSLYAVLVGDYSLLSEATETESDLRSLGFHTLIKEFDVREINL